MLKNQGSEEVCLVVQSLGLVADGPLSLFGANEGSEIGLQLVFDGSGVLCGLSVHHDAQFFSQGLVQINCHHKQIFHLWQKKNIKAHGGAKVSVGEV